MTNSFVYNEVTEFKVKEKVFSLSGDSFSIKTADGQDAFKINGKVFSIRDTKTLLDSSGNKLYKMSEKLISFRDRMYIVDASSGDTVMTVRRKHIVSLLKGTIQVWNGPDDKGDPAFEIVGSILRKNFKIVDKQNGQPAASISKKWLKLTNILTDKDFYVVKVNPGYDTALMVFLAIAVDEQFHDD